MKRDYDLKKDRGLGRSLQKETARKSRDRGRGPDEAERGKSARKPVRDTKPAATRGRRARAGESGFTPPPFFSLGLGERNFLYGDVWVFRHWPGFILVNAAGLLIAAVGKTLLQLYTGNYLFLLGILVIPLLACGLLERGIVLDRRRGQLVRWWRFLFLTGESTAPLGDVPDVRMEEIPGKQKRLENSFKVVLGIPPRTLRIFTGEYPAGLHMKIAMDKYLQGEEVEGDLPVEWKSGVVASSVPAVLGGLFIWFKM